MKPKILIKAATIVPNSSGFIPGMGRATVELINALLKLSNLEFDIVVYGYGAASFGFSYYGWPVKTFSYPIPGKVQYLFDTWLEPVVRMAHGYDLLHITENFAYIKPKENAVVTIHDMIEFHQGNVHKNKRFLKCAKYAKGFVTCSEYTKSQIVKDLGVDPNKIDVIYWGINHDLFYPRKSIEINSVLKKYNIKTPYFFSCSGNDPTNRKNSDILMRSLRELVKSHENVTLVLTWASCPENLKKEFEQEITSQRLILLDGVPDEELACLYSGALATYFISSAEGFGFPILESFACGTPCVTCRNTSLTEIGSVYATFVKERDIDSTVSSMKSFLSKGKEDNGYLIAYASSFNWHNTALKYVDFYKKYLGI